ncbi:double-strand break repair protein AddB [Loktanella sp. F6476L]|uniref:double-strand break repair protein AddB n=1 Tax=Loktanella sp. F6476L TaxID=2926405 RepID=UPI001FF6F1E1|nr:double-strand break repair protein AddB [Loktanella sp. F6476L]MCK0120749.1 double-strand break repair protein AddB [Loktanella sp. F6476L]
MFEPSTKPRIFGLPPGSDFATALVAGLLDYAGDMPPQDFAKIQIFVNTSRMQRRIRDVFDAGPARILPRIRLITDLAKDPIATDVTAPVSPLRRRLELAKFVSALLDKEPELAPRAALYDLSDSLAKLMDEMQGEGVTPDNISGLDITDQSGHWDRALKFLNIIAPYFATDGAEPDIEARQRQVIETLIATWADTPPANPIIVAGSTGSRGATGLFMRAVANLPNGAIVLPGFDFDMPTHVWNALDGDKGVAEDHPQFRFRKLMSAMDLQPNDIQQWGNRPAPNPARNALVSLSLRPAPVTDQWLADGPDLGDLTAASKGLTLVEAPSPRAEAETIALRLRQAAEDGVTAALITPDRNLTRQVAAALDLWNIVPDDSAGMPLALSPPGRFLRHVTDALNRPFTSEALLTLLKHPLCHSTENDRGPHLLSTRELELFIRRNAVPFPDEQTLIDASNHKGFRVDPEWSAWVQTILQSVSSSRKQSLTSHIGRIIDLSEALARGQSDEGSGGLWDEAAGREARKVCDTILRDADASGDMSATEFTGLFGALLAAGTVRDRDAGHPNILIWGTLEARVQSADLVILGGMNEGVWPEAPTPDPWLNRKMRAQAGLLLPERRIGLSAHDYQQAVAGAEVWITRAKRNADAETVPSRWVNRLTNLLSGLPDQNGPAALKAMQSEGNRWIAMAAQLSVPDAPTKPAHRPSPKPPVSERPDTISVTQIKTLIRDPYAIYASKVLRLRDLDPLVPTADAPLRGVIIHAILDEFIGSKPDAKNPAAFTQLMETAARHFTANCPWPTIRAQWMARMEKLAPVFLAAEAMRQAKGSLAVSEGWGEMHMPSVGICITCKADRIDLTPENTALIYDYKTGTVPTKDVQEKFDKQLLAEAVMVSRGAFKDLGEKRVDEAVFLGVNAAMRDVPAPLDENPIEAVYAGLETLFGKWNTQTTGYSARMAMFSKDDFSPYDHLSRFGEWTMADLPKPEDLS